MVQTARSTSGAYQEGYVIGLTNSEHTGWPIDEPPCEKTVVEVICTLTAVGRSSGVGTEELTWLAGLIAGWFARGQK